MIINRRSRGPTFGDHRLSGSAPQRALLAWGFTGLSQRSRLPLARAQWVVGGSAPSSHASGHPPWLGDRFWRFQAKIPSGFSAEAGLDPMSPYPDGCNLIWARPACLLALSSQLAPTDTLPAGVDGMRWRSISGQAEDPQTHKILALALALRGMLFDAAARCYLGVICAKTGSSSHAE
ncbi:hypothetical protein GGTG_13916 [Gaeumannomyces tritici R3-111a-1]|uniref:Uncharacterized protein n=1 Tax=Gaeumannomyces tritici (strain R3-111a-1) TaxID=644352 RepID=J3PK69_GAET3|nr:hypothetical protein GGTG_13916 [Gaeumannomyces tritici R3-111a-1]EJT68509.1 hypothetical protein GGTG_13916 [Gaeumannomyces tritici R3-111a-1]